MRYGFVGAGAITAAIVEGLGSGVAAVRPPDGRAVLEDLTFRPGHVVISALDRVLARLRR
jgi:hypothetical protein